MEATIKSASTCERLFDRYHTYTQRPTIADPRVRSALFASFGRMLGPWLPKDRGHGILDVACGEGSLLCYLREQGYTNLAGCDLSPENVAICHALGLERVRCWNALRLGEMPGLKRYRSIFAMDMIEHLPKAEAAGFLETLRHLLEPGGSVVLQTPNMGSLYGCYHRHYDLSHEFGLTERSAHALFLVAGFAPDRIEIRPAWNATTALGRLREVYLRAVHRLLFLGEGAGRPLIPTKNLLIRGSVK